MCERIANISGKCTEASISSPHVTDPLVAEFVERQPKERRYAVLKQVLLALPVFLLAVAAGMPIGYSPVVMPQLYNSTDALHMDLGMYSWFVSIHSLSAPVGSLISGTLMDAVGRRCGCMIPVVPLVLGWILIASAQSHFLLLAGRMFAGFGVGLTAPPAQILLAECSEPEIRGLLGGVPIVAYSFGILLVYSLGALLTWRQVACFATVIPAISALVLLFVPESPTWLVRKGRREQAARALMWLRCHEPTASRELNAIEERFERDRREEGESNNGRRESLWQLMRRSEIQKPLTIISVFNILVLLAGTYLVVFYVIDIVRDMNMEMDSMHAAIHTGTVRLGASLLVSVMVHMMNRRSMVIASSCLAGASCLALVAFHQLRAGVLVKTAVDTYVPATCLLLYISASMTFMMFPGIMVSELLPARIRGKVSGLLFCSMHVGFFATAKVFPYFAQAVGMDGVFVLFGVSSLVTGAFIYALMPETRGRTLEQIEDYFATGKWLWMRRPGGMRDEQCKERNCEA